MRRDDAAAPLVFALAPCRRLVASIRGVQRGRVSIGRFPNGELHAHIDGPVADRACLVVGSISPPDTHLVELTLLAHSLRRAGAGSITAVLPYLAYARQDRADVGEGLGLAWAGDLLRASGVDRVVSVDVHYRHAPATLLAGVLPDGPLSTAPIRETVRTPVRAAGRRTRGCGWSPWTTGVVVGWSSVAAVPRPRAP